MQGLRSKSALFWAPEKAGVRQPILIFSPRLALGTPRMHRLRSKSSLFWAPEKPILISPRAWRSGPPRMQGLRVIVIVIVTRYMWP